VSLVVRKDLVDSGRYKEPADLKGMKVSLGQYSPTEFLLSEFAARGGISLSDINEDFINSPAGALTAMVNKGTDASVLVEPFVSQIVDQAPGVRVGSMDEVHPGFPTSYLVYGPNFINEQPDVARRFMVAYVNGLRDGIAAFGPEGKDREQVVQFFQSQQVPLHPRAAPPGFHPDARVSFEGVDAYVAWLLSVNAIQSRPDLQSLVDDRFREYAISQLGSRG
jgi:NitT/TauT family transport system substrate-binding protein